MGLCRVVAVVGGAAGTAGWSWLHQGRGLVGLGRPHARWWVVVALKWPGAAPCTRYWIGLMARAVGALPEFVLGDPVVWIHHRGNSGDVLVVDAAVHPEGRRNWFDHC